MQEEDDDHDDATYIPSSAFQDSSSESEFEDDDISNTLHSLQNQFNGEKEQKTINYDIKKTCRESSNDRKLETHNLKRKAAAALENEDEFPIQQNSDLKSSKLLKHTI